jgi:phosphate transport system permease protein
MPSPSASPQAVAWHKKRLRAERRFQLYGKLALGVAVLMLVLLLTSLIERGITGFVQSQARLTITYDPLLLGLAHNEEVFGLPPSRYTPLLREALKRDFPKVVDRQDLRRLYALMGSNAGLYMKRELEKNPKLLGTTQDVWLPLASYADLYVKGKISRRIPEDERKLKDQQMSWLDAMQQRGDVQRVFNRDFFTSGDSRSPEQAGFFGAMAGSAFTLLACIALAFPLGVATAVYLEEFARRSAFVSFIEVNINNLAAVPSIVFGLLGLAVYINVMGLPRSASLVGGLTLALMILPVIIIATRTALKSIPRTIREAALALGASSVQVVWHHTLPLAMPGIMTGTILGMARAIGETAPLIMIGMVAFVVDIPNNLTAAATAMPVQIYLWASNPEMGFAEKTAAGILVLLVLLLAMNALAIYLRKRFEVRW